MTGVRTAIYCRYSSDAQRETSIDDQVTVCQRRVDSEQWLGVHVFSDSGISGSTRLADRAGAAAMLEAARRREFDGLLVEGLDRLSRDSVEQEQTIRRLEHWGIRIVGVSDGYDSDSATRKIYRGMRGIINEVYLDDLRAKTHRGLSGQVARGLFAGGLPYGYRSVDAPGGRRLEVDEDQARWVRWIFGEFARGRAPRAIAAELNERGVPSPRGGSWAYTAVYGHPKKRTGILHNEVYIGRYAWNRSRWLMHPDTGRRIRVERPEREWQVLEVADLRIIPDDLWRAVRARHRQPRDPKKPQGRPAVHLLSGLIRCPTCDGPYTAIDRYRYGCATHKDRGPAVCPDDLRIRRASVDAAVIEIVREIITQQDFVAEIKGRMEQILRERNGEQQDLRRSAERRLRDLQDELENLVDAMARAGWSETLQRRLRRAEDEQERLQALLRQPDEANVLTLRPGVEDRIRAAVDNLGEYLKVQPARARESIRKLLGPIRLERTAEGVFATVETSAAGVLTAAGGESLNQQVLVAGARLRISRRLRLS